MFLFIIILRALRWMCELCVKGFAGTRILFFFLGWLGIYIINLGKTWEKLQLAARAIVAIENPQDIIVQSARPYGQRAVLKFAQYTGAHAIAGRHTPGTFTNQLQTSFSEPRLLILTDPRTDHQVCICVVFICWILFLMIALLFPMRWFLFNHSPLRKLL